ncbi:MAG: methylenetetrahydrofolate reductase [Halobacteriales archaeon]
MVSTQTGRLLADPRFELLPFMGFDGALEDLPEGATVAITASPEKGLDLTVDQSVATAERGFDVVPHVAARAVESEDRLEEFVERFQTAGIDDVFVPGGDNEEPVGPYDSSYALLTDLDARGLDFPELGITGYPEGHPIIDDETLDEALLEKAPHATYIVTQLCFDSGAIVDWIDAIRDLGVDLPVYIGVPGVMRTERMLGIARKVGVGESVRFVRKTTGILGMVRQLLGGKGRYEPDALVEGLAPHVDDDRLDIAGVHLYSFNQVGDLERWRRPLLD